MSDTLRNQIPIGNRNKLPMNKRVMPFGKYQGHLIQTLVKAHEDYCRWLLRTDNLDATLRKTIEYYLKEKENVMNKQIATEMLEEKTKLFPSASKEELIKLVAADAGLPAGVIEDILEDDD